MRFRRLEDLAILLSIAALWPYVVGYRTRWYIALLCVVLAGMAAIAIHRMRAVLSRMGGRKGHNL